MLSSLGRSSETFLTRGADWTDIVAFVAVVVALPLLGLVAVDTAAGVVSVRAQQRVHALAVGALGALAAWQIIGQFVDVAFFPVVGPAAVLVGTLVVLGRLRTEAVGTFLRYGALIVVVVVVQFVLMSPSGSIVLGGRHPRLDPEVQSEVAAAVGDDAPPVVLMVFDALPTGLLLDGHGNIDPELYPNLAELAGTSTWYRHNTTVAPATIEAVPAILSGRLGDVTTSPVAGRYPHNVFTMLGGSYDLHALEPITGLCPVAQCPVAAGSPLRELLGDARTVWNAQMGTGTTDEFFVPGAFDDRYGRVQEWINAQDFAPGGRPDAYVMHVLLPHDGWEYLADGERYGASMPAMGLWGGHWGVVGAEVGRQRHILQTQLVDRIVGDVMERLRRADTFDDAVMVVTADHGHAFADDGMSRGLTEDNYDQIMWTPLIVKSPGQRTGVVDDRNTQSVDVLPTIAAELGVELPWDDLDGVPVDEADRPPGDKWIDDWEWSEWRSDDGGPVEVDGVEGLARVLAADPVPGSGPRALWDRSDGAYGPLVGRSVDELAVGEAVPQHVDVSDLEAWEGVDAARPPLEVLGFTDLPDATTVAVTVDGTIAAVVPVAPGPYGAATVHALLWPGAVSAGENEIGIHVLGGTAEAPTLSPLRVRGR